MHDKTVAHPVGTWVRWVNGPHAVGSVIQAWDGALPMMLVRWGGGEHLATMSMVRPV